MLSSIEGRSTVSRLEANSLLQYNQLFRKTELSSLVYINAETRYG